MKIEVSLRENSFTHVGEAANTFPNRKKKKEVIHLRTDAFHCKM